MSREAGREAENVAVSYLVSRGYVILGRNFNTRFGEIDIIADDGGVVVFVEVKQRTSNYFGGAASAITQDKIAKIVKTAKIYLLENRLVDVDWRIDGLLIEGNVPLVLLKNIYIEGL